VYGEVLSAQLISLTYRAWPTLTAKTTPLRESSIGDDPQEKGG